MIIVAVFLLQAGLALALSLVLARLIGPTEFGLYGIGLSLAVLINAGLYEWLRLSVTRYADARPATAASLGSGYLAVTLILLAALGPILWWRPGGLAPGLLAAAVATGIAMGLFDGRAALARARFEDGAYARLQGARAFLGFAAAIGLALIVSDPAAVLGALALATIVAAFAGGGLARPEARPSRAELRRCAAYAVPLVAASVLYQALPFVNRTLVAEGAGLAEAGRFALAADLATRLILVAGTALDLVLFQRAVRVEAEEGAGAAAGAASRNLALVGSALMPLAGGLWLLLPAIEALVVPASFQGAFARHAAALLPGLLAYALIQYGLNPAFQLRERTRPVIAAAAVGLLANVALALLLGPRLGPVGVSLAQSGGFAAALLLLAMLAHRDGFRLPWRDLAVAAAATGLMLAALTPLRTLAPVAAVILLPLAGVALYGALALALDLAGLRGFLLASVRRVTARDLPRQAAPR